MGEPEVVHESQHIQNLTQKQLLKTKGKEMIISKDRPNVNLKRYNLALPEPVYLSIQTVAERKHTTVLEIIRQFISLGLIADKIEQEPDAALIIRHGEKEREIILL